jgi:hypothetical protein
VKKGLQYLIKRLKFLTARITTEAETKEKQSFADNQTEIALTDVGNLFAAGR